MACQRLLDKVKGFLTPKFKPSWYLSFCQYLVLPVLVKEGLTQGADVNSGLPGTAVSPTYAIYRRRLGADFADDMLAALFHKRQIHSSSFSFPIENPLRKRQPYPGYTRHLVISIPHEV